MVRLTDRPDMTLDVYRGRKTTMQQQQQNLSFLIKFSYLSRSTAKSCDDNLYCVKAILYFFSVIKSRQFSNSKPCLYRAYISNIFELFIVEYHDSLYVSIMRCFIKLKGILISVWCIQMLLSPRLPNIFLI